MTPYWSSFAVLAAYMLPTIIAMARHHRKRLPIAVLNVALGWTLAVWVVTFIWACSNDGARDTDIGQLVMRQTKIWFAAIAAVAMLASSSAGAAETGIDITKGSLKRTGHTIEQFMTVKNNRVEKLAHLVVECGFFHGSDLLETGADVKFNVEAGQTVYMKPGQNMASGAEAATVDRSDCRVSNAQ